MRVRSKAEADAREMSGGVREDTPVYIVTKVDEQQVIETIHGPAVAQVGDYIFQSELDGSSFVVHEIDLNNENIWEHL